ncbi:metallophosphoesterase family protein [Clostridium sp. 'White wine YQ']|uniref:metallophosphoesterase family protein n=1 Tax=Clostridium sp. 'White wine YQ' TaxID=3027474 RepID=UPI002366979A|nr:metallophosphoesterase family protein [Clostridium sp. 'White wine YQ']MDD7793091.1 metallophosphoesterase family protein [Clostridium sp. 'White wine YQ']
MKIGVLSDIHGNGVALKYVLDDMKQECIDKVIILGDVVVKGPMPTEVLEELRIYEALAWVKGNTDKWFEEISEDFLPETKREEEICSYLSYSREHMSFDDIAFINRLPEEATLKYNGVSILCVHGTPKSIVEAIDGSVPINDIKEIINDVKEDIILCGHSHCPFIGEVNDKKIFNVGSIGNSLDKDNRASYGILEFLDNNVKLINKKVAYPIEEILNIAKEKNFPNLDDYKSIVTYASTE